MNIDVFGCMYSCIHIMYSYIMYVYMYMCICVSIYRYVCMFISIYIKVGRCVCNFMHMHTYSDTFYGCVNIMFCVMYKNMYMCSYRYMHG